MADDPTSQPQKSYADLERLVQERTQSLVQANEALRTQVQERLQAEEVLRNSEERYRVLYENNPTMYFTLNPCGTVLSVNNFGAHELGYQPRELTGKSVWTVIYAEDRQVVTQHIEECVQSPGRLAKWEFRKVRKDGSLLWVKEVGCALRDPQGRLMILIVCEDITERKQAEKALQRAYEELEWRVKERTAELAQANLELTMEIQKRERVVEALRASEARLAKTEAFSLVMATHVGLDGRWLKVPPTLCELLGYTEEELLAGRFKDVTHPDDFHADWSQCERLIRGEIKSFDLEKRYIRKDGTIIWIYLNCSVVTDEEGKPIHFITYIRDITKRKQAEEELKQSREQLRALAVYLESVREEERTTIARNIHDELGQALTALNMDLSWMRNRLPKSKPLAPLRDKASAMAGLITHTIESVRRIATELRPGVLDQLGLVAAMEWQASVFQKRYGIACRLVLPAGEIELNAQRSTALFRMLQEALTNVVRHAGATSVTITLDKTEAEVRLTVEDDGKGLSEESLAAPLSLGIAGMRERALALGGAVRIQGIPDSGTTVAVSLPLSGGSHDAEASISRADRG